MGFILSHRARASDNFGNFVGYTSNVALSIPASFSPSAAITVAVGQLAVVLVAQQTASTLTAVSDNLGNTWNALTTSGTGNSAMKMYWSLITNAGSMTPVSTNTSSSSDACILCAVFDGPFDSSPLDKDVITTGGHSNTLVTPSSGTLAQTNELIIAYWCCQTVPTAGGATAPSVMRATNPLYVFGGIASHVVSATTAVTVTFTNGGSNGYGHRGIATFKRAA